MLAYWGLPSSLMEEHGASLLHRPCRRELRYPINTYQLLTTAMCVSLGETS